MKVTLTEMGFELHKRAMLATTDGLPTRSQTTPGTQRATLTEARDTNAHIERLLQTAIAANPPSPIQIKATRVPLSPLFRLKYNPATSASSPQPFLLQTLPEPTRDPTMLQRLLKPAFKIEQQTREPIGRSQSLPRTRSGHRMSPASAMLTKTLRMVKLREKQRQVQLRRSLSEQRRRGQVQNHLQIEHDKLLGHKRLIEGGIKEIVTPNVVNTRKDRYMECIATKHLNVVRAWERTNNLQRLATPSRGLMRVPYEQVKFAAPQILDSAQVDPFQRLALFRSRSIAPI